MNASLIAAISTAPGSAGIGIVRLSGPGSHELLCHHFKPYGTRTLSANLLLPGRLTEGDSFQDECMAVLFDHGRSYTGEESAELQVHGGWRQVQAVLDLCLRNGASLAEPGEFTRRAVEHGRLDLPRAQAVAALIGAQSERARAAALRQLDGDLGTLLATLRERLGDMLGHLEAFLDFAEEDLPDADRKEYLTQLGSLQTQLEQAQAGCERGRLVHEGAKVVLFGAVNAGKSSLLNALCGTERALVSDEPGTTRDTVESRLLLDGIPLVLIDTAGLRQASGVEAQGVERARQSITKADLLIWVLDRARPLDEQQAYQTPHHTAAGLVVVNKTDLPAAWTMEALHPGLPEGWPVMEVSAKQNVGIEALRERAKSLLLDDGAAAAFAVTEEHRRALALAASCLLQARNNLSCNAEWELIAADLRQALDAVGDVAGVMTPADVMNRVFERFCIGK